MSDILGVYARFQSKAGEDSFVSSERMAYFKEYLWGKDGKGGLSATLKSLPGDYGDGLDVILFQFKVLVADGSIAEDTKIENYRPKEKSIGIWIEIAEDNFFSKNSLERTEFIEKEIIEGLNKIKTRIENKKLKVDTQQLIADVRQLFNK